MIHIGIPLKFSRGNDIVVNNKELLVPKRNSVKMWMENYYNGYKKIKEGKDIRELIKKINKGGPLIAVGNSPALFQKNHLEILKNSNFKGSIICTNKSLINLLDLGIVPDAVCGLECDKIILDSFTNAIDKYYDLCKTIPLVVGSTTNPELFDYWVGDIYYFNVFCGEMVAYFMNKFSPHTTIKTCGDVGSLCWQIGTLCNKDPIALIGMEFSYQAPLEECAAYKLYKDEMKIEGDLHRFFREDVNPIYGTTSYVDSIFDSYLTGFTYVSSITDVITYNCTEAGAIHNDTIKQMKLVDFLELCEEKWRNVYV